MAIPRNLVYVFACVIVTAFIGMLYIVYTEKDFISLTDLVIALLPAINYHTDFEHDLLNELFIDQ